MIRDLDVKQTATNEESIPHPHILYPQYKERIINYTLNLYSTQDKSSASLLNWF